MPGRSSYCESERATINWQWLRSFVLELYGLEFAEDLEDRRYKPSSTSGNDPEKY